MTDIAIGAGIGAVGAVVLPLLPTAVSSTIVVGTSGYGVGTGVSEILNGQPVTGTLDAAAGILGLRSGFKMGLAPTPGAAQPLSCFTAGTPVATEDGLQPIETIRRDDRVWAFDLVKKEWRLCRVRKPYSIAYKGTLVLITIAGEMTEATYRHPYWVVRGEDLASRPCLDHLAEIPEDATMAGRWVDSCDLRIGDAVLLRDGRIAPVAKLEQREFEGPVYNMQVEELECYSVGRNGVLVHNNNGQQSGRNPPISPRQTLHTNGTAGKSQFNAGVDVECAVRTAWEAGTPVFDKNGAFIGKRFTFKNPIGTSPGGYPQNSIFVHWSPKSGIHGVPTTVGVTP